MVQIWQPGMALNRPGIFYNVRNIGEAGVQPGANGIVAALIQCNWGPLATVQRVTSLSDAEDKYGTAAGVDVPKEVIRAAAAGVDVLRIGAGGTLGTRTLVDTGAANTNRLDTKYPTTKDIRATIEDLPSSPTTFRHLLIHEMISGVLTLREEFIFAKGAANEPTALHNAIVAKGSNWIAEVFIATGTGLLAAISAQALSGGANPTITNADYTTGMAVLAGRRGYEGVVMDSETAAVQTSLAAWVQTRLNVGQFIWCAIGEPTSVAEATRRTNASSFNAEYVLYVGDKATTNHGDLEGFRAAAHVAGRTVQNPVQMTLSHEYITGGTGLAGGVTDFDAASLAGMIAFSSDDLGIPWIDYGITTFRTASGTKDLGWRKINRMRQRFKFLTIVTSTLAKMRVPNTPDGWTTFAGTAEKIGVGMVRAGELTSCKVRLDPAFTPTGDEAHYLAEIGDPDMQEKAVVSFGFKL